MRALHSKMALKLIALCITITACQAAEKHKALLPAKRKAETEKTVFHAPSVLAVLEQWRLFPTDLNKLICAYDIRPGIFIPFFQKEATRYHDPCMERNDDRLEVQVFGIQPDTFLPVTHRCGLFTEPAPEDSLHLGMWDTEQIIDDFRQAFPKAPKKGCLGVFKSPFDKPDPYPLCSQVSYNVVNMVAFLCKVNVKALLCNTQAVMAGQRKTLLYLPPGVSVTDFARSIDAYVTLLKTVMRKDIYKKIPQCNLWEAILDTTINSYSRISPTIQKLLTDQTGKLVPVFWDGGSLDENVQRVQKKQKSDIG